MMFSLLAVVKIVVTLGALSANGVIWAVSDVAVDPEVTVKQQARGGKVTVRR